MANRGADPVPLSRARILLTNDDGINAPGIKLLEKVVRTLASDVWVVAPEVEQSAAAHSLTLRRPLRIGKVGPKRFYVDGTPTDCIMLAVEEVMKKHPPDLVLSGINGGGNFADDVTYSGTVSAAMEATLLGFRAIALSQCVTKRLDWAPARAWAGRVIEALAQQAWPRDVLMNVNFPDLPVEQVTGIEAVAQGRRKAGDNVFPREDPRGRTYYWIGEQRSHQTATPGSDTEALERGRVTVTPLHMDLTHHQTLSDLKASFA